MRSRSAEPTDGRSDATLRLFCFHCAGGSAREFAPWQSEIGRDIEICPVQLPGRGERFGEPFVTNFKMLIAELGTLVANAGNKPYAFFGHSLGGLIAFELSHYCRNNALPSPIHLFICATNAPGIASLGPSVASLDDSALHDILRDYNGVPQNLLDDRQMTGLLSRIVRADFTLLENYFYRPRKVLQHPLTLFAGRRDKHLKWDYLSQWRWETSGPFRQHMFDGDHFFLTPKRSEVVALLRNALTKSE